MKASIASRVRKGAKLLDKHIPDWRSKIDVEKLNLASADFCIVGQLGWWTPLKNMGLENCDADTLAAHGFEVPKNYYTNVKGDSFEQAALKRKRHALFERLQIEWLRYFNKKT